MTRHTELKIREWCYKTWKWQFCCPSVTYSKEALCDYEPYLKQVLEVMLIGKHGKEYLEQRGSFLYCNEILMAHRIHEESETSAVIGDNLRSKEDYEMFLKILE